MTVIISGDNGVSDVDGSAGTPAIRGTDANTGIFFGADQVGVATNGVERVEFGNSETVFNDGGANVDFRVEGDTDTNLLFVDASADAIGIGTSSPDAKLDVRGSNSSILISDTGRSQYWRIQNIESTDSLDFNANDANVRMRLDSSGNLLFNSGFGSVATAYGCRAWVNFDGTTNVGGNCTIRASGNVSTVADNGQGNYTVNFTTAMPDANYAFMGGVKPQTGQTNETFGRIVSAKYNVSPTTSALRIITCTTANGPEDFDIVCVAIFR
jgi:hypothetical protein